MILRRIARSVRAADWVTLGLELVLVVAGILLAFQLDRAYQAAQDRQLEERYLERLHADLSRDTAEIARVLDRTERRIGQVALLEAVRADPERAADEPRELVIALEQVTWRSVPGITTTTYDELRATGRAVLIRSESLRAMLAGYYGALAEQQRLGLGEDDQEQFRTATVGLLSGDQLSAIEDPTRFDLEVTPAEAVRIARAFADREAAHPWLGRLQKYQVLMARLARRFQASALEILYEIERETDRATDLGPGTAVTGEARSGA